MDEFEYVPEFRYGTCPWCKLKGMLTWAVGNYHGEIWSDYICLKCLNTARVMKIGSVPCFEEEK